MTAADRRLIVNADDFGLSPGTNRGIVRAHEQGLVTSASLMVLGGAAGDAAAYARGAVRLSVGLHVDLAEWRYSAGGWKAVYEVVDLCDAEAVAREVERQLGLFRVLVSGDPTHLDSHQHVHRSEPVRSVLRRLAAELRVPLRGETPGIRYCGDFYGQTDKGEAYAAGITVESTLRLIGGLGAGVTELGCHPAAEADMQSVYAAERVVECDVLCDARVLAAVSGAGVILSSFRGWT
jgi:chitin disaccharide deacetylase